MKFIAILQARMGSSRLPGKVLMDVDGENILQHVVNGLGNSSYITHIVVATTILPEDDAIEHYATLRGIACYRGSDWDVLDRYYHAALASAATSDDCIIRICCDNPLISGKVADFVIKKFLDFGTDYFSNSNQEPHFLEDGFDVEVFRFSALERAWADAKLLSQREHVTPFIKNSGLFSCGWQKSNEQYTYKLSVDTQADLEMVRAIFRETGKHVIDIEDVVNLLSHRPELLAINQESTINSGYQKSLNEDRIIK